MQLWVLKVSILQDRLSPIQWYPKNLILLKVKRLIENFLADHFNSAIVRHPNETRKLWNFTEDWKSIPMKVTFMKLPTYPVWRSVQLTKYEALIHDVLSVK